MGRVIYQPPPHIVHSCDAPNEPHAYPIGTQWLCDCGRVYRWECRNGAARPWWWVIAERSET